MKVLLVADAVGGVFTWAIELSRALLARGVRVVLATEGAALGPDRRRAVEGLRGAVHEGRPYRLEWMEDPWEDVAAAGRWLLELEARERPDVVHTSEYAHGALPFRAPKLVTAHSCVLSWFEAVRGVPAPPRWDRYRAAVRAGLRGADAVAAPSAWMARAIVRHHGPLAAPHVVANGRDAARFPPGRKRALVLGAGRVWDEAKGLAALARVAPRLPWPVEIAGDAEAPGAAAPTSTATTTTTTTATPTPTATAAATSTTAATSTPAATSTATGSRATFLGRLSEEDLAARLAEAAVFAHPARYEPFGLAALEAALAGCALVLGDVESLRESWEGAAELVPPGDDDALARALAALARDGGRREALAARARDRALRFTPARMAEGYLSLYRALAGGRAAQGRHA